MINNKTIGINKLIVFLITLSVLSTVFIQFFIESGGYQIIRTLLYGMFSISFFMVIKYKKIEVKNNFIKLYLIAIYLSLILSLTASVLTGALFFGTVVEFSLPLIVIFLGYSSGFSQDIINKIVFKYMWLVTALGLFIIFNYGEGFKITDNYFFSSKNQVGPFIASVVVISMISLLKHPVSHLTSKKTLFLLFSINASTLVILRNRSGLVAVFVCLVVYLSSKIKIRRKLSKNILLAPLTLLLISPILTVTGVLSYVGEVLSRSLLSNYNLSDINSISANRFDVYINVIEYLKVSPFFGELATASSITQTPHNFLLNLWLNYGLLGMLPITLFYVYISVFVIKKTIFEKEDDMGLYLVIFMLVISLFEYSFPFSPLTTVSLSWFLFGGYLKRIQN